MSEKDRADAEAAAASATSSEDGRVNGAPLAHSRHRLRLHRSTVIMLLLVIGAGAYASFSDSHQTLVGTGWTGSSRSSDIGLPLWVFAAGVAAGPYLYRWRNPESMAFELHRHAMKEGRVIL